MKTTVKSGIRGEQGKVLIMVLILLVVGGLVLTPLLGLMSTGLISGQVYERKTAELYAADAGVEEAIWRIQTENITFVDDEASLDSITVNDKAVKVEVKREGLGVTSCGSYDEYRYYILSEATGDGSTTTVNAVLSALYRASMDFSGLLDYAIASDGTIHVDGGGPAEPEVRGDVYIWDREDFDGNEECIKDPYSLYDRHERDVTFPTYEQLSAYYWDDVKHLDPCDDDEINVDGFTEENPCVLGTSLWAPSSGKLTIKGDGSIEISGTVYVKGDLHFNGTPKISVILREEAVLFVEGNITMDPSTPTDDRLSISGSGCIIARNDIDLKPMVSSNETDDYVLVLSLEGHAHLLPMGAFQGTVASTSKVTVKPRNVLRWTSPEGKGINFPMGDGEDQDGEHESAVSELSIIAWQIG